MDYFQLDKVFIAGHSMGGQVALYTAKNFPDRVNKLVLLNSSTHLKFYYLMVINAIVETYNWLYVS